MEKPQPSSPPGPPPSPEVPARPPGLLAAFKSKRLRDAWRSAKALRRDLKLRLRPALARRRAASQAEAAARLRVLVETRPERALALLRRVAPHGPAAALLTARLEGWAAAAPLFLRLAPGEGSTLLRRSAEGAALDLAPPVLDRVPRLAPQAAARLVVYVARFGPQARTLPPLAPLEGARFLCLSDRDDPAEGWEVVRFTPPKGVAPAQAAAFCRIRPEIALAKAAPEAEASLHLAPEILLTGNLDTLLTRWLAPQDFAAWRHPRAQGWRDLAEAAALAGGEGRAAALDQARDCEAAGLPPEGGAVDSRILWRRHKDPAVAALGAAWWAAFARNPGDPDLALARALLDPAAPPPAAPRILPAALGTAEESLFFSALPPCAAPPARPAPRGRGRLKVAMVYARGYEHYAATMLRGQQLAGLIAERFADRYDLLYTPEIEELRDQVVVLTKWALERRRPAEIAALRERNVAVIASWDDKIPTDEITACVDAQMSLSLRQTVELNRRHPATPTFFVTHHVNRLIRPGAPPMDRLRAGYFGELFNTMRPASIAGLVELNGVETTRKAEASWMDALDRYNCHWIVRRRHPFDGAKPFLKGFLAARCGAVVVAARDDGDAALYLGDDYPFYVSGLSAEALEADMLGVLAAFGGPDWRKAEAIMRQVAARSADEVVCDQFRAMIDAVTA